MTNDQAQCEQGPSMDETVVTSIASGLAALLLERTLRQGKDVEIEGMGRILGGKNIIARRQMKAKEKECRRSGQTDATA